MTPEIEQGNRMIAEFMEVPYKFPRLRISSGEAYEEIILPEYHSNWSWLMPVVEKIHHHYDNESDEYFKELAISWVDRYCVLELKIHTPIKVVWESVVQFIHWYTNYINKVK